MKNYLIKRDFIGNLKKVLEFLKSNLDLYLNMEIYQSNSKIEHECNTAACILGHSTRLLSNKDFEDLIKESKNDKLIFYPILAERYFSGNSEIWFLLFGTDWPNNIKDAIHRIETLISCDMDIQKIRELEGDNYHTYSTGESSYFNTKYKSQNHE